LLCVSVVTAGAVYARNGQLMAESTTFEGNSAFRHGGAVYVGTRDVHGNVSLAAALSYYGANKTKALLMYNIELKDNKADVSGGESQMYITCPMCCSCICCDFQPTSAGDS
jgi:predicted outer membrane repeat protein